MREWYDNQKKPTSDWRNHKKIFFDLKFILENVVRYNCFVCFSKIHENSSNKRTS